MNRTAVEVLALLKTLRWKIVLVESCTGGAISAELTKVPGISSRLCGSFVVYRLESKHRWLGISPRLLGLERGVGDRTARALARAALKRTPEATIAVSVTGHLGPHAPKKLDGKIFGAIALRQKNKIAISSLETDLKRKGRQTRQRTASLSILKMVRSVLTRERPKKGNKGEVRNANAIKLTKRP